MRWFPLLHLPDRALLSLRWAVWGQACMYRHTHVHTHTHTQRRNCAAGRNLDRASAPTGSLSRWASTLKQNNCLSYLPICLSIHPSVCPGQKERAASCFTHQDLGDSGARLTPEKPERIIQGSGEEEEDAEGIRWVKLQPVQAERLPVVCGWDSVMQGGEDINVRLDGQLLLPCGLSQTSVLVQPIRGAFPRKLPPQRNSSFRIDL